MLRDIVCMACLSVCLSVGLTHVRTYGNKKIRETINSMTIIISFQGVLF